MNKRLKTLTEKELESITGGVSWTLVDGVPVCPKCGEMLLPNEALRRLGIVTIKEDEWVCADCDVDEEATSKNKIDEIVVC